LETSVKKIRPLALFTAGILLSGCSGITTTPPVEEEGPVSFFTGKVGGTKLTDFGSSDSSSGAMPVNALLWRAALDISSFVPLDDVDTFGGTIVTEWYSLPDRPDERIKLTIFVIGRELRSDAISVRVYLQRRDGNSWLQTGRDNELEVKIEDLILTRAREIRASTLTETAD
jgi:hypothetical protein